MREIYDDKFIKTEKRSLHKIMRLRFSFILLITRSKYLMEFYTTFSSLPQKCLIILKFSLNTFYVLSHGIVIFI